MEHHRHNREPLAQVRNKWRMMEHKRPIPHSQGERHMSCQVLQALASTKRGVSQQPLASPSFKRLTAYSLANSNGSCILLNHKSSSAPMNHSPKCPTPPTNFMAKDLSYHHQQDQRLVFFQKFFQGGQNLL